MELDETTVFKGYTDARNDKNVELLDNLFTPTAAVKPSEEDAGNATGREIRSDLQILSR